jgi:hypothetical protein
VEFSDAHDGRFRHLCAAAPNAPTGVGGTSISGAATEDPVGAAAGRGSWTSCLASPPAVQAETAPDPSDPLAAVHVRPEGVCSTGVGRLRPLHITSEYLRSASVRIPKAAGTRQPLRRRTLCHFRRVQPHQPADHPVPREVFQGAHGVRADLVVEVVGPALHRRLPASRRKPAREFPASGGCAPLPPPIRQI